MVYFVNFINFFVIKYMSVLILQVLGNVKGVVVVVVFVFFFWNLVIVIGMVGYSFIVFGVVFYSEVKWWSK